MWRIWLSALLCFFYPNLHCNGPLMIYSDTTHSERVLFFRVLSFDSSKWCSASMINKHSMLQEYVTWCPLEKIVSQHFRIAQTGCFCGYQPVLTRTWTSSSMTSTTMSSTTVTLVKRSWHHKIIQTPLILWIAFSLLDVQILGEQLLIF